MVMQGETIMTGANDGKFGTNGYSELKVLMSAAGYYLGTTYQGMPGSRESGYFASEAEAEDALEKEQLRIHQAAASSMQQQRAAAAASNLQSATCSNSSQSATAGQTTEMPIPGRMVVPTSMTVPTRGSAPRPKGANV